ncbi:MAG: DUF5684 domain-containing protein [Phycisphaerales bacterium]
MVKFECSCGFRKAVDDKYAGKNVRCPKCGQAVTVSTQKIAVPASNAIKAYCALCNKKISVPPQYAGKKVKCPLCKTPLDVPAFPNSSPQQPLPQTVKIPAQIQQSFDDVSGLADMEKTAKKVELPPELQPQMPAANAEQQAPDFSDRMMPRKSIVVKPASFPIGALIGITILIVVFGIFLNSKLGTVEKKLPASREQIDNAQIFSRSFIEKMNTGDINEIKPILTQELQTRDPNITKNLLASFKSSWNANYTLNMSHSAQLPEGNAYMFIYDTQNESAQLVMVFRQQAESYELLGLDLYTENDLIQFEGNECAQVSELLTDTFKFVLMRFLKRMLVIMLVLFAITRLSKAIVFYRADESPWAAIIPVYHEWTLAEVGAKSGLWAIVACVLSGMPFVYLAFMLYASLGVAETHNRGIFFGIGLWLLPFIFYPILVFSEK